MLLVLTKVHHGLQEYFKRYGDELHGCLPKQYLGKVLFGQAAV